MLVKIVVAVVIFTHATEGSIMQVRRASYNVELAGAVLLLKISSHQAYRVL